MKALILSSTPAGNAAMQILREKVEIELWKKHTALRFLDVSEHNLAYCQGEFDCWVKTPGVCKSHDFEQEIVQAFHDADTVVFLSPVAFGGYDHRLKRAIDRMICLVEPFFVRRHELTRHEPRYAQYPRLFSVGWTDAPPAPGVVSTFLELNDANAANLMSPFRGALVLHGAPSESWDELLHEMMLKAAPPTGTSIVREVARKELFDFCQGDDGDRLQAPKTAAILMGSAKPEGKSASEVLARALERRFVAGGVQTQVHVAREFVHDGDVEIGRARDMAQADLLVVVTPLYVDSLPSLVTHALQLIAEAPVASASRALALVINCGFPEPEHNRVAVQIARHFARQAQYRWMGALPLGGGGVLDPPRPLEETRGSAARVAHALALGAESLQVGRAFTSEAIEAMAARSIPDGLYRFAGDLGFRWQAFMHDVPQKALHARPLDVVQA